jgi:hyperosmotically inducible protein
MARLTYFSSALVVALLVSTVSAPIAVAQTTAAPASTWSQDDSLRVIKEVQNRLGKLNSYGVFDWITFGIQGKTIVLKGYASRPVLKDDASRALKGIPGVENVINQIDILPNSPADDSVRAAVYNRIYTQPGLRKYNANAGNLARATGPGGRIMRMAGGITNDPPIGYHAIHIIVKNGNVILYGVVLNQGDFAIAGMQANSAPGAFSVDNDLVVEGAPAKSK